MLKLPARIYHARTGELFRLSITGNFVECAHSPSPSPRRLSYKVNLSSAPNKVASGPQKPGAYLVHRVRKFVEVGSGRIGYAMTQAALSEVSDGATWNPDPNSAWPTLFLPIQNLLQC